MAIKKPTPGGALSSRYRSPDINLTPITPRYARGFYCIGLWGTSKLTAKQNT